MEENRLCRCTMRSIGVSLNKRIEYYIGLDRTFVIYLVIDPCFFVYIEFFQGF
jgi:hypothetical protein